MFHRPISQALHGGVPDLALRVQQRLPQPGGLFNLRPSLPASQVFLAAAGSLEAAARRGCSACCRGAAAGCEMAGLPALDSLLRPKETGGQ